jgi:copper transport protein
MSRVTARRILGLACVVALAAPAPALAHANLTRSDPANGAVVAAAPRAVRLFFDDTIRTQPGIKAIQNGGGSILAGSPRVLNDRTLVIPLRPGLRKGDYTVLWRALSDDGHPIAGILTFAVGSGRARPQPGLTLGGGGEQPLEILERWLFLAGVLAASGAALFTLALRNAAEPPQSLFLVAFLAVVAGGVPLVVRTSLSTRFGAVVAGAVAVAAVGGVVAAAARRYPRVSPATWLPALLLLPAPSLAGHALDAGRPRFELPVDIAHVAASSIWLGGLLALAAYMRRGDAREAPVRTFSALALASVVVLAATGVIRAFAELTSVGHVWTTSYGRLLVVKTALLAALVAVGWVNRYRLLPAFGRSVSRLRRNVLAELVLFAALVTAVAFLTQSRPDRDRVGILAAPAAAGAPASPEAEALVLGQTRDGLLLEGTAAQAVRDGRSILWQTFASDEDPIAKLALRNLRTRRTTTLARDVAPQFGLGVTPRVVVYATSSLPPQLVAIRRSGGRRVLLARRLIAPFASRGERVAWAEEDGERQRVVVHDFATGKDWVAADMPKCKRDRCYRVDAVTLADRGVAFDRGAIGAQPSLVVRHAFSAPRPEALALANDPQPDLVPSSAGALYYALGQGWRRWDFGRPKPARTSFAASGPAQPIRYEDGRWFVQDHRGCDDTILAHRPPARPVVVASPATARALAGVGRGFCAKFIGLTWTAGRVVTTWAVAPADPHAHAEGTGVILFGPRIG